MYSTCQAYNNKQINYFVGDGYYNKLSWENVENFLTSTLMALRGLHCSIDYKDREADVIVYYLHVNSLLVSFDDNHVLFDDRSLCQCWNWQRNFSDRVQLDLVIVDLVKDRFDF
jgi:hypothetical protein